MANLPQDLSIIRVQDKVASRAIGGAGTAFLELAEQVLLPPKRLGDAGSDYFCNPARVHVDFYLPNVREDMPTAVTWSPKT